MSRTFQPSEITWTAATEYGTNYQIATLAVPEVTTAALNGGAIMVYGALGFQGSTWTALPVTLYEGGITEIFGFSVAAGTVRLRLHYGNNAAPGAPNIAFRVVIIPPAGLNMMTQAGVAVTDAQAVLGYLRTTDSGID